MAAFDAYNGRDLQHVLQILKSYGPGADTAKIIADLNETMAARSVAAKNTAEIVADIRSCPCGGIMTRRDTGPDTDVRVYECKECRRSICEDVNG